MGLTCEQKLAKLEQETKALKATYSIYGGRMKTYMSSGKWSLTDWTLNFAVKFKPDFETGENILISSLHFKVYSNGREEVWNDNFVSIQNGSGEVILNTGPVPQDCEIEIFVASTVPGTFTRIS